MRPSRCVVLATLVLCSGGSVTLAPQQIWITQVQSTFSDSALAAAADPFGGVYLAGWVNGPVAPSWAGGADAWLARYDRQGVLV